MAAQFSSPESMTHPGLNLFSATSVKFWGLGGAALASLMLFPDGQAGELLTGLSVAGMGAFLFWNRIKPHQFPTPQRPESITQEDLIQQFTDIETLCTQIETDAQRLEATADTIAIRSALADLQAGCDRTQLNLVITGDRHVGKTTLCQCLSTENFDPVVITEQSWSDPEIPATVSAADFVLFMTQGDLTQSELNRIQLLQAQHQPTLVMLNKVDQLMPSQREALMNKFGTVLDSDQGALSYVAIAASPHPITVRRHQADGSIQERQEQPAPEIHDLLQTLAPQFTASGRQQLVWQHVYHEALTLRAEALRSLNALRRQQALPLIEKYQWISASAAFASPLPSTDMIAAAAITGKLVTDLGDLYHHRFSVSEAQNIAAILAQALLKLGLVELSSQLLGVALKSHAATYVAGGLIQGLSVAYLTHIAGLSLVEHFEAMSKSEGQDTQLSLQSVQQIVARVFAQNQRVDFLKGLVGQGVSRLQPAS